LRCSDQTEKDVADVAPLLSEPCVAASTPAAEAALVGRQPAHNDPSDLEEAELARLKLKPLSELGDMDQPLSAMLVVQDNTSLWIFPGGCDDTAAQQAYLVDDAEVGDIIVWCGTHAGAGYAVRHIRWHAYLDPPPHIYVRPRERDGTLGGFIRCLMVFQMFLQAIGAAQSARSISAELASEWRMRLVSHCQMHGIIGQHRAA
jgi:hypothetical protein